MHDVDINRTSFLLFQDIRSSAEVLVATFLQSIPKKIRAIDHRTNNNTVLNVTPFLLTISVQATYDPDCDHTFPRLYHIVNVS